MNPRTPSTSQPPACDAPPTDIAVWGALASEPGTCLGIYGVTGRILWLNPQSIHEFFGDKPETIGKTLVDTHGPDVAKEWCAFYAKVVERRKPVLIRGIFHGRQYLTWLYPIDGDHRPGTSAADDVSGPPMPDRVLSVTRPVAGKPNVGDWSTQSFEFLETDTIDLGPLDVLTPRELEVLALLGTGLSAKEAAGVLHRSVKTIVNHRTSIGQKLNIDDRVKLAELAQRAGLTVNDAGRHRLIGGPPVQARDQPGGAR